MASSAKQQLIDLQKAMYNQALHDARESAGVDHETIAGYQEAFERSLPEQAKSVPARKILEAIDNLQIMIFGDFHSHKQSQRAFLRILRMYLNRPDHAPVTVLLEMIRSSDQMYIDLWTNGHLTDQELLDAINYDSTWGFPWNNYRPILELCKYQKIRIVGINSPKGGKDSLKQRDDHAASVIAAEVEKAQNHKIFCMIGEFHLADDHLPKALAAQLPDDRHKPIRLFANVDKYFFSLDPDKIHHRDEYLHLAGQDYCVINSPPWIKWQSQSLWEEMRRLGPVTYLEEAIAPDDVESDLDTWDDDDANLYTEDVLDLDYHLRHLQRQLSDFFKIPTKSRSEDTYKVAYGKIDEEFSDLSDRSRQLILTEASTHGFSVNYYHRIVYMPDVSINNMAAAAGQMLFGTLTHIKENYETDENLFVTLCLKSCYGAISNKILNPRLPLTNVKKLESYVLSTKGKRLIGSMRNRRQNAKITLRLHDWISKHWTTSPSKRSNFKTIPKELTPGNSESRQEIAQNLAHLIAEPICRGIVRGKIDTTDVQRWFIKKYKSVADAKAVISAMISFT